MTRINKRKKVFKLKLPFMLLCVFGIFVIGIFTYSFGNLRFEKTIDIVSGALHKLSGSNRITYNSLGGSSCSDGSYTPGSPLSGLCQPTLSGYTFAGWVDENHELYYDGKSVPDRGNIELTAAWVPDNDVKCKRATVLHTALCNSASGIGCRGQGLTTSSTITFGKISTSNNFEFGDAYDCDVDGDGIYDPETERFYYITDLEGHDDVAVLLYYTNVRDGLVSVNSAYKWFTSNVQTSGPATAAAQLPKISQWMNMNLQYPVRDILDNSGAVKKSEFDYSLYSARLLTYQELLDGSGSTSLITTGDFNNYPFLLENTQYNLASGSSKYGYWLETGNTSAALVYNVSGRNRDVTTIAETNGYYSVRPAIEVLKSQIHNTFNNNNIKLYYMNNGGSGCMEKTVIYGSQIGELCVPVKTGYTFVGWFDENDNPISSSTTMDNPNGMNLYAKWSGNVLCRRASTLSKSQCKSASGYGCRYLGYASNEEITFGNGTISSNLLSGNPLICDVNGDGNYDEELERFYYVTDLNGDYVVLSYYNNAVGGVANNANKTFKYYSANNQTYGPTIAVAQLPTSTQWPNVSLYNNYRNILSSDGTLKKENFDYTGYSARFLTYEEVNNACGVSLKNTKGLMQNCSYLLQNTQFENSNYTDIFWLETPASANTTSIWYASGKNVYGWYQNASGAGGVRPAIDVQKSNIELTPTYTINYDNNGGDGCSSAIYYNNQSIGNLCIPHRDTYYFTGWIDENNQIVNDGDVFNCNNEDYNGCVKNLTASWSKTPILGAEWLYTVTNSIEKFTVPVSGVYLISVKGGKGAQSGTWNYGDDLPVGGQPSCNDGSKGGAVRGSFLLTAGTELYVIAGGAGKGCAATNNNTDSGYSAWSSSTAGFNGLAGATRKGASGGASQVAFTNTLYKDTDPADILISAYGGAGRSASNQSGINYFGTNYYVSDSGLELGIKNNNDGFVYIRLLSFN